MTFTYRGGKERMAEEKASKKAHLYLEASAVISIL